MFLYLFYIWQFFQIFTNIMFLLFDTELLRASSSILSVAVLVIKSNSKNTL